jgi:L-alanine-DL-glutamate epimerase-like enolase superfamily enzyme
MLRRDFFKTLPGLAALPLLYQEPALAARFKITDVRLIRVRLVKDVGTVPRRVGVTGGGLAFQIGGFTVTEVHTDQGLVGIGPGIDPGALKQVQGLLVGRDPFDINRHATVLYAPQREWGAPVEIALWDLLGKAADQPLYKLWGGTRDRVLPYAAMWGVGTPRERGEMAARIKADGWRAIKLRSGFPTLKEDVQLVEEVRKATDPEFHILTDGNKAPGNADAGGDDPTLWNFKRAVDTAREYQRLGVYWLEEPLPRYAYDLLGEMNRLVEIPMAGGEANWGIHEFRGMLDEGCFDVLMPEVIRLGPLMSRNIGVLAAAENKRVSPHGATFERRLASICAVHLVASIPNAPIVEFIHEPPIGDIFAGWSVFESAPVLEKDGYMKVPQGPGLGVKIRPDLIEKS